MVHSDKNGIWKNMDKREPFLFDVGAMKNVTPRNCQRDWQVERA
jgi:hypothetical protein